MKIKITSHKREGFCPPYATVTHVTTENGKALGQVKKIIFQQSAEDVHPTCTLTIACPKVEITALAKFELDEEYEKLTSEFSQEDLAKMLIALRKDYIRLLNEETDRQFKAALNLEKQEQVEKEIISQVHYENSSYSDEGEIG